METKDIRKKLEIDRESIDEELSEQASMYLFVAEKAVDSELQYERQKALLGQLEAHLDMRIREQWPKSEKMTESALKAKILTSRDFISAQETLMKLRSTRDLMKALRESWYQRKDCLIQLAIKQRSEYEAMVHETIKTAI